MGRGDSFARPGSSSPGRDLRPFWVLSYRYYQTRARALPRREDGQSRSIAVWQYTGIMKLRSNKWKQGPAPLPPSIPCLSPWRVGMDWTGGAESHVLTLGRAKLSFSGDSFWRRFFFFWLYVHEKILMVCLLVGSILQINPWQQQQKREKFAAINAVEWLAGKAMDKMDSKQMNRPEWLLSHPLKM